MTVLVQRFVNNFTESPYQYVPTKGIAIMFIILFSLSTIVHMRQATSYRMWWLWPTVGLCGLLEVIGWSGRLWSSISPLLGTPFKMQIVATIMGPTPLLAANFVIFGAIIHRLGAQYSRLNPTLYAIFFLSCDVISLIIQGVGGGMASAEFGNDEDPAKGGHVMLGGIAFQLFVIILYASCAGEFFIRYLWRIPIRATESSSDDDEKSKFSEERGEINDKMQLMIAALLFSTLCLIIRAVYRTIELADGWEGTIIGTQVLFNVLDGAMITLAMYTMNFAHPGLLLGRITGLPGIRFQSDSNMEKAQISTSDTKVASLN